MKKVWVIENFIPVEKLQNDLDRAINMLKEVENNSSDEQMIKAANDWVDINKKALKDFPNGRWCGQFARTNYKDFCYEAKELMYRHKDWKFRVVKAELPEDAEYWWNYVNAVVNEGVLKYFYATKWW